ncbi:MAG: carboxypeptidase regulatory-like domain-containing protein, partial [Bacteroidetes bacterium]|nr:carboxypeptidase regulatory-like domain-containing protein [Bacteroidota bacterium]
MRKILLSILFLSAVLFVVGCKNSEDDSAATDTPTRTPSIASFQPKGTISGLIVDRITRVPVGNAVISVGFDGEAWTTTSNAYGVFSFANVPAGQYRMVNGNAVATGTYTMTVSLVDYNAAKKDSSQKYRNYYYSTVTITFTSISQGDSVPVGGMVGNVVVNVSHLNTTLNGSVVDQDQQPVANALVTLYDATVAPNVALGQTRTDSAGAYHFTNIDNGLTVDLTAESADGSLEGSFPGTFTLPANVMTDSLRMQVTAEVLRLAPVDNVAPKVIAISPKENEDVAATFTITIDFSEPIKQTPYTRTDLALGHNTIMDDLKLTFTGLKKTNGDLTFSAQWQNNNRTLLITPQGITGASKYTFDMTAASNSGKLTDIAKNALVNNAALTGDFEALQFTTNGNSTAPAAPVLVRRMVKNNFSDLNYTGGTVGLQWNFDANVRSYNLYRSIGNEPFELIQKNIYNTQFSTNTGSLVIPAGANDPLKAVSVNYIVKAVSKDLIESNPSNTITVSDAVAPKLNGVTVTNLGSGAYLLSLAFNEPLIISSAENISNYSFQNKDTVSVTITKSDYLGFSGGAYKVQLAVTSNPEILPQGYTLTVASAVVDLN